MRRCRLLSPVAALILGLAAVAGCGESAPKAGGPPAAERPELTVSAATSLKRALTEYGERFPGARTRLSFAGSDELAAQIRQGVKPDVYAAANTKLPTALYEEGLIERPRVFAANRLVLAVPASEGKVRSLEDLARADVALAVGAPSVPIGSYTREVLGRLGETRSKAILARVRSNEPDVGGVVGKISQGAVDAGFVYVTDVTGAGGALRAIDLPGRLEPSVAYGVGIVKGARRPAEARRFVDGLVRGEGAQALRRAGFEPPPG